MPKEQFREADIFKKMYVLPNYIYKLIYDALTLISAHMLSSALIRLKKFNKILICGYFPRTCIK